MAGRVTPEAEPGATSRPAVAVRFPDGSAVAGVRPHAEGDDRGNGKVMVRPEDLELDFTDGGTADGTLSVSVEDVTFLGETLHIGVRTAWGQKVSIRTRSRPALMERAAAGASGRLRWTPGSSHFFQAPQ